MKRIPIPIRVASTIAVAALANGLIREPAALVIQLAAVITFVVSSYVIVLNYPTPIAVRDDLRQD